MTKELKNMIEEAKEYKAFANDVCFGKRGYNEFSCKYPNGIGFFHQLMQKITIEMAAQKIPMEIQRKVWKIWA